MNEQCETASKDALKTFQNASWTSSTVNIGLLSIDRTESEGQVGHFHLSADQVWHYLSSISSLSKVKTPFDQGKLADLVILKSVHSHPTDFTEVTKNVIN